MNRPPVEVVHGDRGHRGRRRLARRQLHDRGAEPHVLSLGAPPGQRGEPVGAVRLRGPDRVEAEPVGLGDRLFHARGRARTPVAGVQPELQILRHRCGPYPEPPPRRTRTTSPRRIPCSAAQPAFTSSTRFAGRSGEYVGSGAFESPGGGRPRSRPRPGRPGSRGCRAGTACPSSRRRASRRGAGTASPRRRPAAPARRAHVAATPGRRPPRPAPMRRRPAPPFRRWTAADRRRRPQGRSLPPTGSGFVSCGYSTRWREYWAQ